MTARAVYLTAVDCEGTLVNLQLSSYISSHSPEFWTNPEEFNPYRLEDEELLKRYESTNDLNENSSNVTPVYDSRFSDES